MSTDSQKGRRQASVETNSAAGWPLWIADALAYKPEQPAVELSAPGKPVASEADERRNIRILSRFVKPA
jgi:hypothetical protein